MKKSQKISERTLALLYNIKKDKGPKESNRIWISWILKDLYHYDLKLADCIHHLVKAVTELRDNENFEVHPRDSDDFLLEILEYPFKKRIFENHWSQSIKISQEEIQEDYIEYLISKLKLSNISWCIEYSEYCEEENAKQLR